MGGLNLFKDIRRKDRIMDNEKAYEILRNAEYGVMATIGENSWPYATPLSFVLIENEIYFHCATSGHKLDNISFNEKVCFNVVGFTKPVYDNNFTTYYESVTVFGNASRVVDEEKKYKALYLLCEKYLSDYMDKADEDIKKSLPRTEIYKISIEHISAKEKKVK